MSANREPEGVRCAQLTGVIQPGATLEADNVWRLHAYRDARFMIETASGDLFVASHDGERVIIHERWHG